MKTIKEIRLQNLQWLIANRFNGNKGRFADAIDRPRPNVSRLLSEKAEERRSVGEDLARAIEGKLDLPTGWLDIDHDSKTEPIPEPPVSPRERAFIELIKSLPTAEQDKLMRELEEKERYFKEIYEDMRQRDSGHSAKKQNSKNA